MYEVRCGFFAAQKIPEHCYVNYVSPSNCAVLPTHLYCRSLNPQAPWWHYPILKYFFPPFPAFFSGISHGVRPPTCLVFFKLMSGSGVLKIMFLFSRRRAGCRGGRLRLKCDGTRAETIFRLLAKGKSPFKSAGVPVQSTTGSRVVRISGSDAGYTIFRGSVKSIGYPRHSPVSPSLPLPPSPCAITFKMDSTSLVSG